MRWEGREGSSNVEDRRGMGMGRGAGLGCGGLLVVAVIALLTGADPQQLLQLLGGAAQAPTEQAPAGPGQSQPQDQLGQFASVVLRDTEVTWEDWDKVLDTNLKGSFFVTQAFVKHMIPRKYGRIIHVGSVTSVFGYAGI